MGRLLDFSTERHRILVTRTTDRAGLGPSAFPVADTAAHTRDGEVVIFPGVRYQRETHGKKVTLAKVRTEPHA